MQVMLTYRRNLPLDDFPRDMYCTVLYKLSAELDWQDMAFH